MDNSCNHFSVPDQEAFTPQIAGRSNGDAIATFFSFNGTAIVVQSAKYDFKHKKWNLPINVSSAKQFIGFFGYPGIALDDDGNALATWLDSNDGTNFQVWGAFLDADSSVWKHQTLISPSTDYSDAASVSIDSKGNGVVTWTNETLGVEQAALWRIRPAKPKFFHGNLSQKQHGSKKYDLHTWWKEPNQKSNVSHYEIFEDKKPIKKIKASHAHKFHKFTHSNHHLHKRFEVRAHSHDGLRSRPAKLKINPVIAS